jgi:hypothetical protein
MSSPEFLPFLSYVDKKKHWKTERGDVHKRTNRIETE